MAEKIKRILIDDLDGSDADETVKYGIDGRYYQIDLSTKNAKEFRELLKKYTDAGTKITQPKGTNDAKKIREWAEANGYPVAKRGRLHADIVEAFHNSKKR